MYNSVAIDKPHDPGTWMSGDTHTESGGIALLDGLWLQLADKYRLRTGLSIGISLLRHTRREG